MIDLTLRPGGRVLYTIAGPAFDCPGVEVSDYYYNGQGRWKGTSFSGSGPGSISTSIRGRIKGTHMSGSFIIRDSASCQLSKRFTGRLSTQVLVRS